MTGAIDAREPQPVDPHGRDERHRCGRSSRAPAARRRCAPATGSSRSTVAARRVKSVDAADRRRPLRRRADQRLYRRHACAPRGPPRRARARAVGASPATTRTYGRMLIGFNFGVTAKPVGVFAAAGVAVQRDVARRPPDAHERRARASPAPRSRQQMHSIVGISEIAHESVLAGAGYALVFARLHLAGAGRHQPVPVPAARRRPRAVVGRREGARASASRSLRCTATARSGSCCCCSS